MSEIQIGLSKNARPTYSLDDVALVPTRRTRDRRDVDTSWQIDAFKFDTPIIGAPMDSVMSPATAIALGKLGGLGVLNLEGLWTRYEDPQPLFDEIVELPEADPASATTRMQQIYSEPIKPELITARLEEIRDSGVVVAGSLSPQNTQEHYETVVKAGVELFVIRGASVSAEHISTSHEPLNLKKFIYELDVPVIVGGVAGYSQAKHLMRTGAAGVLVGFGGGSAQTTRQGLGISAPMATAIADVAAARSDYLDESGADAVMLGAPLARTSEAPGQGLYWGNEAHSLDFPRGVRTPLGVVGSLEEVLYGPSHHVNGTSNIVGALKRAMANCGYLDLKKFQKADLTVVPSYRG